ncbi:FAD:protein FMN transferase [Thalassoroseus pseudoceratinae]|uniref:FAD:protein FMN transferase n=1 Tax=Thalassoroseus pseudoceratinae TaxID=2713176 RepID=UPI001421E2BC|nr:FAD:protein FMN transferase [Thalassoroseus pseudoceratinae]
MLANSRLRCHLVCFGMMLLLVESFGVRGSVAAEELVSLSGETMGTTYNVRLVPTADVVSETLQQSIDDRLEVVNLAMSTWDPESELSRFNRYEKTDWFPVSAATAEVVEQANTISEQSGGAFDVTVMPLVNLWHFGPEGQDRAKLPSESSIESARASIGYQLLHVRSEPPALRKDNPSLTVDLSAIAKGYGVDVIARLLDETGIENYLVEIGGEVRSCGVKPNGDRFIVGIEKPTPFVRAVQRKVPLQNSSMATSGDYRNFFEIDGKRYSHTIDPRTGRPVEHSPASVSVIAQSCMEADAVATTLMVLGPDAGYNWAEEHGYAAIFLIHPGERGAEVVSEIVERETSAFSQLVPTPENSSSAMTTWLISLGVFVAFMVLMSVGVIFSNRRIQGSCGGLAGLRDEHGQTMCQACTTPREDCEKALLEGMQSDSNSADVN